MLATFLFILIAVIFYLKSKSLFLAKDILVNFSGIAGFSAIGSCMFLYLDNSLYASSYHNIIFALFFALSIVYIVKKTKSVNLSIQANQQRYWEEITPDMVYNFYKVRQDIKSKRVDVIVNEKSKKFLYANSYLSPQFFIDYKRLQPKQITKVDELYVSQVYSAIFNKISSIIKDRELKVDYQKVLESNGNYVEYFLMDLWENHAKKVNVGVSYLEIIATNDEERELIYALNLIFLHNIQRKGAVFYYKYKEFKNEIASIIQSGEIESDNENEVFDEKYANEMDTDKNPYKEG